MSEVYLVELGSTVDYDKFTFRDWLRRRDIFIDWMQQQRRYGKHPRNYVDLNKVQGITR